MSVSTPYQCTYQCKLENNTGLKEKIVISQEKVVHESHLIVHDLGIGAMAAWATFAVLDLSFNAKILSSLVHEIGKDNQNEKGPLAVFLMILVLGAASGGIFGCLRREIEKKYISIGVYR